MDTTACTGFLGIHLGFIRMVEPIRDFSSPQWQPNQTYCTAGESLLTCSAGLWARAQACHWNRQKSKLLGATVLKHRAEQQQTQSFGPDEHQMKTKLFVCRWLALCFKMVALSSLLFLTVPVTSSDASLLCNNNTDRTGDYK